MNFNALSVIFGIIYMSLPIPIIATAWQRKYITDMKEFCCPIGRMYTPAELQASSKLHCELSDGQLRRRSSHRMLSRLAVPLVEVQLLLYKKGKRSFCLIEYLDGDVDQGTKILFAVLITFMLILNLLGKQYPVTNCNNKPSFISRLSGYCF